MKALYPSEDGDLALFVYTKPLDGWHGSSEQMVSAYVVTIDDHFRIRNVPAEHPLHDLHVACYQRASGRDEERHDYGTYGWCARYMEVYAVDLDDAERMAAVLRKLQGALKRLNDQLGYAQSYPEYLGRVAMAMGITRAVWQTRAGHGYSYADSDHAFGTMADGVARARHLIVAFAEANATQAG